MGECNLSLQALAMGRHTGGRVLKRLLDVVKPGQIGGLVRHGRPPH
jgi:hypothetical protein